MKRYLQHLLVLAGIFTGLVFSIEVKAQDFIDEDFLENIETNAKFVLTESAAAFSVSETPAKWNDESAVIIGYKRSILFDKKNSGGFFTARQKNVFFFEKVRFKIQLHDRNSVDAFSEIYFRYSSKEDGFLARIIKPGGEISPVNLKEAVQLESTAISRNFLKVFLIRPPAQSRGITKWLSRTWNRGMCWNTPLIQKANWM